MDEGTGELKGRAKHFGIVDAAKRADTRPKMLRPYSFIFLSPCLALLEDGIFGAEWRSFADTGAQLAALIREARLIRSELTDFPNLMPNAVAALAPNAHHGCNGEHPELFTPMIRLWMEHEPLPEALHVLAGRFFEPDEAIVAS